MKNLKSASISKSVCSHKDTIHYSIPLPNKYLPLTAQMHPYQYPIEMGITPSDSTEQIRKITKVQPLELKNLSSTVPLNPLQRQYNFVYSFSELSPNSCNACRSSPQYRESSISCHRRARDITKSAIGWKYCHVSNGTSKHLLKPFLHRSIPHLGDNHTIHDAPTPLLTRPLINSATEQLRQIRKVHLTRNRFTSSTIPRTSS